MGYYMIGALRQFIVNHTLIRLSYRLHILLYSRHYIRIAERIVPFLCIP